MTDLTTLDLDRVLLKVQSFYADYAAIIDRRQGAQWVDQFTHEGLYSVTTLNNAASTGMWWFVDRGRVKLYERAAYSHGYFWHTPDKTLHQISNVRVLSADPQRIETEAYLVLFVADRGGPSELYVCGEYRDVLVASPEGGLRFAEHRVVLDAETVPANMGVLL